MAEKIELTEGLHLWSAGAHTVASIEVQAIRLWLEQTAAKINRMGSGPAHAMISEFMGAAAAEPDHEIAEQLLSAKESELLAGRVPMSMDAVRQ